MNILKRHKGLAIIGGLSLILLIVLFAIFSRMLFSTKKGEYGDRLKGITAVSQKDLDEAKRKISENEEVESVTIRTQGKIIYTTIYFTEKTTKDKAKEIASKSLEYYEKETLETYDFEFLLTQKIEVAEGEEDKSFTIAGNKHPDVDHISWTRN